MKAILFLIMLVAVPLGSAYASNELEQQAQALETELQDIRKQSVSLSQSIRINEARKDDLDQKIEGLEKETEALNESLSKDQRAMADLILALQRMRRTPPEAVLIQPTDPVSAAQSAMLLSKIIPQYQDHAKKLQEDLELLSELKDSLAQSREAVNKTVALLEKEEKQLQTALNKRQKLYRQTREDIEAQEAEARRIAAQARTAGELVSRLSRKPVQRKPRQRNLASRLIAGSAHGLPVTGRILVGYSALNALGAQSQGIEISSKSRAIVASPMEGIVRFSGPFKKYGNMVIVEHSGGYHSLIAGLEKVDTVLGQDVLAGEPVGRMGREKKGQAPILYYELRYKGKAVDPAKKLKIAGL